MTIGNFATTGNGFGKGQAVDDAEASMLNMISKLTEAERKRSLKPIFLNKDVAFVRVRAAPAFVLSYLSRFSRLDRRAVSL